MLKTLYAIDFKMKSSYFTYMYKVYNLFIIYFQFHLETITVSLFKKKKKIFLLILTSKWIKARRIWK
jgi:hypothetical protein